MENIQETNINKVSPDDLFLYLNLGFESCHNYPLMVHVGREDIRVYYKKQCLKYSNVKSAFKVYKALLEAGNMIKEEE